MHSASSTNGRPAKNGNYKNEDGHSDPVIGSTLPLSISRPSRPMTPSSASPSRPTRSSMRPRQISQHSFVSVDTQRESIDVQSTVPRQRKAEDADISPVALAAIAGFQDAGRKRALTIGKSNRDAERAAELQEERKRQRKIQEKVPGRSRDWRKRAVGGIDGTSGFYFRVLKFIGFLSRP